jgi:hypothetical protein
MRIVSIFAENLYAFQYDGEAEDEYTRLRRLWIDVDYLRQYATQNNIVDRRGFINDIRTSAEYIADLVEEINENNNRFEVFFKPLNNLESGIKVLSLQKGRRYKLRIYAIKIDENLFVITGGAIKLGFRMDEHEDTQREKGKLEVAKRFFQRNGVFDNDSFYELINEDYED